MYYLVILPHDSAPLYPSFKATQAEGVVCVVVDRGFGDDVIPFGHLYVAGDNPGLGRESGIFMRDFMTKNNLTNYVVMGGMLVPLALF